MKRICVFCGSNVGARPTYAATAQELGLRLAQRRIGLVYGGGCVGLMGLLADEALAAGAEVIGILPEALDQREIGHRGLTELRVVQTMHERKAMMADLSDGFIALPGGFGTMEEFCEVLTWAQLGLHAKPCGLLNVEGYYDPFLTFLDHLVAEQFVHPLHRSMVLQAPTPVELLDQFATYKPVTLKKWITSDQT